MNLYLPLAIQGAGISSLIQEKEGEKKMERLTCNVCRTVYTEEADIKSAKRMKQDYEKMCKQDNFIPKGIAPCPNMICTGELILITM